MKKKSYNAPCSRFYECETEEVIANSVSLYCDDEEEDAANGGYRNSTTYRTTLWGD